MAKRGDVRGQEGKGVNIYLSRTRPDNHVQTWHTPTWAGSSNTSRPNAGLSTVPSGPKIEEPNARRRAACATHPQTSPTYSPTLPNHPSTYLPEQGPQTPAAPMPTCPRCRRGRRSRGRTRGGGRRAGARLGGSIGGPGGPRRGPGPRGAAARGRRGSCRLWCG